MNIKRTGGLKWLDQVGDLGLAGCRGEGTLGAGSWREDSHVRGTASSLSS